MGISFLFSISFLLHIVSLAAIYFLFKQLAAKQEMVSQQPEDFLELMDTYLEEIRFENDKLQQHIGKKAPSGTDSIMKNTHETPKKSNEMAHIYNDALGAGKVKDQAEMSLEAKILQLHRQGKKTEEIAKELDCGKTEAELVIKFHAE